MHILIYNINSQQSQDHDYNAETIYAEFKIRKRKVVSCIMLNIYAIKVGKISR